MSEEILRALALWAKVEELMGPPAFTCPKGLKYRAVCRNYRFINVRDEIFGSRVDTIIGIEVIVEPV